MIGESMALTPRRVRDDRPLHGQSPIAAGPLALMGKVGSFPVPRRGPVRVGDLHGECPVAPACASFPLERSVTEPPNHLSYPSPAARYGGNAPRAMGANRRGQLVEALCGDAGSAPGLALDSKGATSSRGTPSAASSLAPYTVTAGSQPVIRVSFFCWRGCALAKQQSLIACGTLRLSSAFEPFGQCIWAQIWSRVHTEHVCAHL